ncbi:sensor domain-containing diguanylate cyclase [Cycloclasticus zancles]|uniref:diguanylate cyclase n=1 Tax=Cycloclasticus zancles 78-ME TaxID=1198232 RepID=S5TA90_9GAMM|nr:diguanylate cyclase [Cycloclasticus zancles]AGS40514.1 Diguanylate cyclase with PAS/PAC sensor [Cycloclasticus zancles 78-ME]
MSTHPDKGLTTSHENLFTFHLLDSITIPTFAINTQHEITHWNKALEKATGFLAVDMIGTKKQWKPFYPNPRPTLSDLIIEGAKDESVERFYTNKYHRSNVLDNAFEAEDFFPTIGSGEWLLFSAAPILNANHDIIGAVETLINISEQKHSEKRLFDNQQKYRELSTLDDLTQLYNARHFFSEFNSEVSRCDRYRQVLSICMLDLDDFKQVNDTYGHQFGNTVLTGFADIIKENIRHVDVAFRYGGEEFVILFPFVISNKAAIAVKKIRAQQAQKNFVTDEGKTVNITVSAGVATYLTKEGANSFIKRADKAMYQAKENGKNQVVIAK